MEDYDPNKFYVASTNDHDHSELIRFRIPQGFGGKIRRAVEQYPEYKGSQAAFIRDAIVHRLYQLLGESKWIEHERLIARAEEVKFANEQMARVVESVREAVKFADCEVGRVLVSDLVRLVDGLGEPQRSQWMGEVIVEFGDLL